MPILDRLSNLSKRYLSPLWQKKPRNTIFTCTKNEDSYVLEWICYHRLIGFDKVVIVTNDNSDNSLEIFKRLKHHYSWFDFIEHTVPPDKTPGIKSHEIIVNYIVSNGLSGYGCLCDIDEFLLLDKDYTIHQLWRRFPSADVVAVNWRIFGSSGELSRQSGLVIDRFTKCAPDEHPFHRELKSIFKIDTKLNRLNSHYPTYSNGPTRLYIHPDGLPMHPRLRIDHPYTINSRTSFGLAQFNHYVIKSREEFLRKRERGRLAKSRDASIGNQDRYTESFFKMMDLNEITDKRAQRRSKAVRQMMMTMYKECGLGDLFNPDYVGL